MYCYGRIQSFETMTLKNIDFLAKTSNGAPQARPLIYILYIHFLYLLILNTIFCGDLTRFDNFANRLSGFGHCVRLATLCVLAAI